MHLRGVVLSPEQDGGGNGHDSGHVAGEALLSHALRQLVGKPEPALINLVCHFGQFHLRAVGVALRNLGVVGAEECNRLEHEHEVVQHSLSDCHAVVGRSPAAQLVNHHQAPARTLAQDPLCLLQLYVES